MEYNSRLDWFAPDIRSILTGEGYVLAWDTKCCFVAYGEVKYKTLRRQKEGAG